MQGSGELNNYFNIHNFAVVRFEKEKILPKMESNRNGEYEVGVIKMFHDEAYSVIDRGLFLEENNRGDEARSTYENGIRLLEQALSVRCDHNTDVGENWDKARFLQMKMRKTREDVLSRLSVLVKERPDICCTYPEEMLSSNEMPPSYEEACVDVKDSSSTEGKKSFHGICPDFPGPADPTCRAIPPEARSVFTITNGVQIFFVSSNGDVSAPSYPTVLNVYKIHGSSSSSNLQVPPAFLSVGEWIYPLIPGQIPVLHTTYGAYMLPDVNSNVSGSAVGLVLTDSVSRQDRQIFEHLLCELTVVQAEIVEITAPPDSSERRMSTKISNGIVTGAEMLSKGMLYGAEKTSEYIKFSANKWRDNMEPVRTPTNVDSNVQKGLHIAKNVSGTAVKVSGYLINQLGKATMALGQHLAPHVRKHGTNLLSKAFGEQEPHKADQTMDGILEVAGGGLKGFSTVYLGLEKSAKILANSLISETVTTVHYKYGSEAATSTDDGLRAVGNIAHTSHNISHLGIKAIAKKTATDTGKALIMGQEKENGTAHKSPLDRP